MVVEVDIAVNHFICFRKSSRFVGRVKKGTC